MRQAHGMAGTARALAVALAALAALAAVAPAGAGASRPVVRELPNLVPLPPGGIRVWLSDDRAADGDWALRFSTVTANRGGVALDVAGVPSGTSSADAYQCVAWAGPACVERVRAGSFVWHPAHSHFHVTDYAAYELRSLLPDDSPDFSAEGLVAGGEKVSFCLMDTEPEPGAPSDVPFYSHCPGVLQGISAGWRDVYGWQLAGQQIPIAGVPYGRYALVIRLNPAGTFLESATGDNISFRRVELYEGSLGIPAATALP